MGASLDKQIGAKSEDHHRPLPLNLQPNRCCLHQLSLILTVSHRYLEDNFLTADVLDVLHLTRYEGPDWVAYKGQVDLIIIKLENLLTHQSYMNSNKQKISFSKRIDQQMQLPDQQLPPLQRPAPKMSVMLKRLMAGFTRNQVTH
jgi:hypothetical protein